MQAEASQTELSTPPGTRGDLPNDGLPAEEAHTAASESAMPDTGPPGENSQTGVGDGSDSQVAEFDQQNGADDPGFDRKGQDAETREAEISVGSDSSYAAKRPVLKAMVAAIAIAVLFGGFFVFDKKSGVKTRAKVTAEMPEKRPISQEQKEKSLKSVRPPISETGSLYSAKLQEVTDLRDTLLRKQEEIGQLKTQYRNGIEELEKEISDALQKGEIGTFQQAMDNKAIAFALRTIQRRQAYIQQLEAPSQWIFNACEDLLYIKRRTLMDIQVAEVAGGIDMSKHMQAIDDAVGKYRPTAERLALDETHTEPQALEVIWERIREKSRQYASVQVHSTNQIISEQICMGNFNRLSEISEISPQTAKCISEMRGADLFLNGLNEISPGTARQLFKWKGSWICMNGIRALSPRVAHYLFQWDGNWISLNGLTEFPAEVGEALLQWRGRQLELMGLAYTEDFPTEIAVEYLARWERAGGKLFVPRSVRNKIDELNREPA